HGRLAERAGTPLVTSLIAREPRREPLVVPAWPAGAPNGEEWDGLARIAWPDLPAVSTTQPQHADRILLPRIDEHSIGQLLQFLVLAEELRARCTLE
ncbi:MAG: hypothetical protein ACKOHG_11950, partial [Planctomycetia bacterium]